MPGKRGEFLTRQEENYTRKLLEVNKLKYLNVLLSFFSSLIGEISSVVSKDCVVKTNSCNVFKITNTVEPG